MHKLSMIELGIYEHYRGNKYQVIGTAKHSETLEEMVVYRALYESEFGKDVLWVRPINLFTDTVEKDGREIPRFKKIDK